MARAAERCRVLVEWTVAPSIGGKHSVVEEVLVFVLHPRLGSETGRAPLQVVRAPFKGKHRGAGWTCWGN